MDTREQCPNCRRRYTHLKNHNCRKCDTCSRYFATPHSCRYRRCRHCNRLVLLNGEHHCQRGKWFNCRVCHFRTASHQEMINHRNISHVYTCQDCDFTTKSKKIMEKHHHIQHKLGTQTFKCPYLSLIHI